MDQYHNRLLPLDILTIISNKWNCKQLFHQKILKSTYDKMQFKLQKMFNWIKWPIYSCYLESLLLTHENISPLVHLILRLNNCWDRAASMLQTAPPCIVIILSSFYSTIYDLELYILITVIICMIITIMAIQTQLHLVHCL